MLVLNGTNAITCEVTILTNKYVLTIRGTGSLDLTNTEYNYMKAAIYDGNQGNADAFVTLESGSVTVRSANTIGICVGALRVSGGTLRVEVTSDDTGIRAMKNIAIEGSGASIYVTTAGSECFSINGILYVGGGYTVLYADTQNATEAEMQVGEQSDIKRNHKTIFIGATSAALLSMGAQQGELYQGAAGQVTFAVSGLNLNWNTVRAAWEGEHPGLTAALSANGKTLTITADTTAIEGTYDPDSGRHREWKDRQQDCERRRVRCTAHHHGAAEGQRHGAER